MNSIDFTQYQFHPVINLPKNYQILDFTKPQQTVATAEFTIGRFNEKRPGLYTQEIFNGDRNIHVGIDIGAPAGTEIRSFYAGKILYLADNSAPGDYGPTLVTSHQLDGVELFSLWGHLHRESLLTWHEGDSFTAGDLLAKVGTITENGGWPPHLHFQLSLERPMGADLPGVVSEQDLTSALQKYPDPRLVLGPLY